ncbi:MAG TPA: hypothetical protein VK088_08855 [Acidimicrobiia bacterium]|nr:hypothetical protein [Acidimicrobiia bacterium]
MAITPQTTWMVDAVVILENGSVIKGEYDGYGRVDSFDIYGAGEGTYWHQKCWEVAGSPTDYRGISDAAPDQGWFFRDGLYDDVTPGIPHDPPTCHMCGEVGCSSEAGDCPAADPDDEPEEDQDQ